MALIKCPDCGKMFSEYAEYCPECGCPVKDAIAAYKETETIPQHNNRSEENSVPNKVTNSLNEGCEAPKYLVEKQTNALDESSTEDGLYSDVNDSKEKMILGIFAAIVLGGLLIYGLFHYFNKPNSIDNKSETIAELAIDSIDNSESTESNMEQQIIARAEYIFKNIPDHKELNEIDKSVFSFSFLNVLEKASEINKKSMVEGDLSMEGLFYWYSGQDGSSDDGLVGISLISYVNSIAIISVKYRNFRIKEHRMKLIFQDGKWLCDNWDKKKEELAKEIENVSKNVETEILDYEQNGDVNDEFPVDVEDNYLYENVDEMPQFAGGASALYSYLSQNIEYPIIAEENGIQGRVIVTFVVERDGSITDVKVAKSDDPSLNKEALRLINSMPKWRAGRNKGKPVRVKYTVPISFRLQ